MLTAMKTKRLLVSRQDPESRLYSRLGELRIEGAEYVFSYDDGVTRPLPGLALEIEHRATELFPIFAERVIHPQRPDYQQTLSRLGLDETAGPFEVLAISGGRRTGDTYELTPLPEVGAVKLPFLVHGIRHLRTDEQAIIDALQPDQVLTLQPEPKNAVNDRAVLVTESGTKLGYVPDPLLDYVHKVMEEEHSLVVVQVNPPEAGFHMRLLVELEGTYRG